MVSMTAPSNYFCMAKITEAILNKIKACGTFIIKFCIKIHLLKDDSRYHENKWRSLVYPEYCILSAHTVHTYNSFLSTYYLLCWRNEREALQRIDPDYSTFQFRWNWKLANSIWQLYRWLVCEIAIFKWFAHTLRCHGNKEISCWLPPFFVTRKMKFLTYIAIFVSTQIVALIYFVTKQ